MYTLDVLSTYIHALRQIFLVRVHNGLHQAGEVNLLGLQRRGIVRGHCIAAAVRRTGVTGVRAPVAFLVQFRPVDCSRAAHHRSCACYACGWILWGREVNLIQVQ